MSEFGFYSISAELTSRDFYLLENYFKILVGSQASDCCPLGYLFLYACFCDTCYFYICLSKKNVLQDLGYLLHIFDVK